MDSLNINLFTLGDCSDINTWSNVPYHFYRALLAHKISVNPINLVPLESVSYRAFSKLMALRARVISECFNSDDRHELLRTKAYYLLTNRKIRTEARQPRNAALNLFMTFSFSSYRYVDVPVVHYCDQTYEHYLEEIGQKPTRKDRLFIQIDRTNVENADLVLTTNQQCCDFIKGHYKARRVFCLTAGINTGITGIGDLDAESLIARKENSKDILFIGRGVYKRGVDILIKAFKIFNERRGCQFTLHIVGVKPEELPRELQPADPNIRFYSYLDRSVAEERDLYQKLLQSAKIFVFPMRPSPDAGVIREAQLNCTPIIVSKFSSAVTHGHNGIVVDSLEPGDFANQMDVISQDNPRWRQMARNGHESVKSYTWAKTVENFLAIVSESGIVPFKVIAAESAEK